MNPTATRQLVHLQCMQYLIEGQGETLAELYDMKEMRAIAMGLEEIIREASARELVPVDPIGAVKEDWERMCNWSNQLQEELRAVDEIAVTLVALTGETRFSQEQLDDWITQLEDAPTRLRSAIEEAQAAIRPDEWKGGVPDLELVTVVELFDLQEPNPPVIIEDNPDADIPKLFHPLTVSYREATLNDTDIESRLEPLRNRLEQAREMLAEHSRHTEDLAKTKSMLAEDSEPAVIHARLHLCEPRMPDLDYSQIDEFNATEQKWLDGKETELQEAEANLKDIVESAENECRTLAQMQDFANNNGFLPPLELSRRCGEEQNQVREILNRMTDEVPRLFEVCQKLHEEIKQRTHSERSEAPKEKESLEATIDRLCSEMENLLEPVVAQVRQQVWVRTIILVFLLLGAAGLAWNYIPQK
jgi:hypothetical protein